MDQTHPSETRPWLFGPRSNQRLCGAKKRGKDELCQQPAMKGKARCRLHGGKSTGIKTKEGKDRQRRAVTKSGLYSAGDNPVVKELFGITAPGPKWPGHRHSKPLTKAERERLAQLLQDS